MAEPTDLPDLRALAAEAIPYELISTPAVGIGGARRIMLAEVVLAAVLPAATDHGYQRAIANLRDGERYGAWVSAQPYDEDLANDEPSRQQLADYLAATAPADGLSASMEPEVDPAVPGTATHSRMSAMAERAEARRVTSPDYPDSPEHVAEQSATTEALAAWQSEAMRDCGQPQAAESAPAVGREVPQAEAVPLETLVEELGATDPVFRAAAERTALIERLAEGHWRLDWPHQGYGWADENRPTAEAHRRGARRCLDAIALAGLRLVPAGVPGPQLADLSRVTRERDLLKAELEIGRQVQRSLMDEVLRCVADLRIAAARVAELEAAAADREQGGIERAEQANG